MINKCYKPLGENCPERMDPCCNETDIPDPEKIYELVVESLVKKRLGENQSYLDFNLYGDSMILQNGMEYFTVDDTIVKIMTPKEENKMAKHDPRVQGPEKSKVLLEDKDGRVVLYHKEWRSTISKMYEDP